MKITYYGHSCFAAEIKGKTLLFDPFITPNELARDIDISIVPADYILITHGHSDHIADAVDIARRTGAMVLSNYEIVTWLGGKGVKNGFGMNHGGTARLDFGSAKYVNAIHSSSLPDGGYGGNPGGWVIESDDGNFYHSGDTALMPDMKLIAETTRLRFAALCIGDTFTMGINDAVRASDFLQCGQVLGLHYDTFPPIKINHDEAVRKFRAAGKALHLMEIGATQEF